MLEQRVMLSFTIAFTPSPQQITEGQSIQLGTITATAPDDGGTLDSNFTVDWGDGSAQQTLNTNWNWDSNNQVYDSSTSASHQYTEPTGGAIAVWTNETRPDDTVQQGCTIMEIEVDEAPSSAIINGYGSVDQASTYWISTDFSDAGGDSPASWTIAWGDGQEDWRVAPSEFYNHVFNTAGNMTVTATANSEDGQFSTTLPLTVFGPAPSNLTAAASGTQVNLNWIPPSGTVTAYHIERSATSATSGFASINDNTTSPSYTDTTATPGMTYWYRVRSDDNGAYSTYSNVTAPVTLVPGAPTNLSITPTATSLSLAWTASPYATSYTVSRKGPNDNSYLAVSPVLPIPGFTDPSVLPNTAYSYEVVANDGGGSSPASSIAGTTPNVAPAAPASPQATTVSSSQINLAWTDNSNNESGFKIDRSPDNVNWTTLPTTAPANATSYIDSGLIEGTLYYYRIRATNSAADSANAPTVSAYTLPAAPTNLTAAFISGGDINLTWTNNSAHAIYNYVDQSTDNVNWSPIGSASGASYSFAAPGPFSPSTKYYFRVRASGYGGYSGYANSNPLTTPAFPIAPSLLTATAASTSQINLIWQDNSNNESGFKIDRSPDGSTWTPLTTTAANVTGYSDTGVTEGTLYYYRVRATNSPGDSANTAAAYAYALPAAPTNLTAAFVSGGDINLTWTNNSAHAIYNYVEQSLDNNNWSPVGSASGTSYSFAAPGPFSPSTRYYFRVRAWVYGGYSGYANSNPLTTPAFPIAPSLLTATTISSSQINLTWQDNSSNESGFAIERSSDGTHWTPLTTVAANATSYSDAGLGDGKYYYYQVSATNAAGSSAFTSSAYAFTPYIAPTIVNPATAGQSMVTGATDTLSVLGSVPGGQESELTYVWSVTSGAAVSFSPNYTNAAKNTTVAFTTTGNYTFQVRIENGSAIATSSVSVSVDQGTVINVTPGGTTIAQQGTQQFTAEEEDQFGNSMESQPQFTWSVVSGGGTIDANGLFTAPSENGSSTIQATAGNISGQVQIATNTALYRVTITGRAYEPNYSASYTSGSLSVTNTGWITAATPEDAVQQAISGTITLNTKQQPFGYDDGDQSRSFPADLNRPDGYGFAVLASNSEGAANKLTWDAANSRYTGAIGLWDGDSRAPYDWDFYWNVTVDQAPTLQSDVMPTSVPANTDDNFGSAGDGNATTTFQVQLYSLDSNGQQVPAATVTQQVYTINLSTGGTIVQVTDTLGSAWVLNGTTASVTLNAPNNVASFDITVVANFSNPGINDITLDSNVQSQAAQGGPIATLSRSSGSPGRTIKQIGAPGPVVTPTAIYHINDQNAVFGKGHSAVIIPNGAGCTYFSYSTDGKLTVMSFNNITDALTAAKAAGYTREEHWNCTPLQAQNAWNAAAVFNNTEYQVPNHNCWHMVYSALQAAGENVDDAGTSPNMNFNNNEYNTFANGWSNL